MNDQCKKVSRISVSFRDHIRQMASSLPIQCSDLCVPTLVARGNAGNIISQGFLMAEDLNE